MSLVAVQTPQQVSALMAAEQEQRRLNSMPPQQQQSQPVALSAHIQRCWQEAKQNRLLVTQRLLNCHRRKKGEYSPQRLAEIKETGASEIFMMITGAKCRAAKAWLSDLFNPVGGRAWKLEPSPVPDLPPEIKEKLMITAMRGMQEMGITDVNMVADLLDQHKDRILQEMKAEGEKRCERMCDAIDDMLLDAGWRAQFGLFLDDLVTFPFAAIRAFEFRAEKKMTWMDMGNGNWQPQFARDVLAAVRRISPYDFYPAPSVTTTLKGHWWIERRRFTRSDLVAMRGVEGYNNEAIAQVLMQYRTGGLRQWMWDDAERSAIEGRPTTYNTDEIDAIEWEGSIQGSQLIEFGVDPRYVPDPQDEYLVSVLQIGNYIIRAMVNADPEGNPSAYFTSWQKEPGTWIGTALPEILADTQDMCNSAARSLQNNMAISSGPQVWVESDRMATGTDYNDIHPWKVWVGSVGPNSNAPVGFFQPTSNANELMTIYERFAKYADEISGLPAYAYGSDTGAGAAKTASGLSMLMNAASKNIKHVVFNVDVDIVELIVLKAYNHQMLRNPDPSIKGDARPKALGSQALVHKEAQQMRTAELLQTTVNPLDSQIMGLEGRAELLREVVKGTDIPSERIVPSQEELKQRMAAQMMMAMQQPQGKPADGKEPTGQARPH